MTHVPRRRWFQFKLTTWFVLAGILAWAFACWPWWSVQVRRGYMTGLPINQSRVMEQTITTPNPALIYPALALLAFLTWKAVW
jgi:hypothetical protein